MQALEHAWWQVLLFMVTFSFWCNLFIAQLTSVFEATEQPYALSRDIER